MLWPPARSNHPNILTIYDIGAASVESGGAPYVVDELPEGDELRAKLNDGANHSAQGGRMIEFSGARAISIQQRRNEVACEAHCSALPWNKLSYASGAALPQASSHKSGTAG